LKKQLQPQLQLLNQAREKVVRNSVATQKSEPASTPSKPVSEPTNSSSVAAQYEALLRAYLEKIKRYPSSREARLARPEGIVKVALELTRSGELISVSILESSGFNLLDSETIKTIKSGTFPPFPEAAFANQSSHKFIANMKYTVSSN
jgi:protein TonB